MIPFLSPPPIDVDRELAAMRAELAAIRSGMQDGWMDEERAGTVRGIVRDALADSATRTSFLTGDCNAGYAGGEGGGAYFRARNGSATMNLAAMVQNRFVASSAYGPVSPPPQDTNTRWGFETKTLFLVMSGQVIDKSITYVGVIAYTSQTNRFIMVPGAYRVPYASIRKGIADGMGISMGLLNVPWDLESNYLGSSTLTSGDYSVFNQLGTLSTSWDGWYQGVNLQASSFVAPGVEPFVEACWMDDVPVEWIAQAGINLYEGSKRVKITLKAVIPFGGGNVNGIPAPSALALLGVAGIVGSRRRR